jgi:hypothetical protein
MRQLHRDQLRLWRAAGINIFVIPAGGPVDGMAWAERKNGGGTALYINMMHGDPDDPLWLFVLLHEVSHHHLRHTTRWTSTPHFMVEYEADMWALAMIRALAPETAELCEQASRDHIRPRLQLMIDEGIWHHVDREIAEWAGCDMTRKPTVIDAEDDEGIPF